MKPLFTERLQVLVFDWANVVARAFSVAGSEDSRFLRLLAEMLIRYRRKFPGLEFVFALEGTGTKVRRKLLPGYKLGGRKLQGKPTHFDTLANEVASCCEGRSIMAPLGEADDAIACFLSTNVTEMDGAVIVTEDRDLWQLVKDPSVKVYTRQGDFIDEAMVQLKFHGLQPNQIRLYKTIMGDKSDNVPKVPLLGKAKALKLLQGVDTPKRLQARAKKADWLPPKVRDNILVCKTQIRINYKIVGLKKSLELVHKKQKAKPNRLRKLLHSNSVFELMEDDIRLLVRQGSL